MDHLILLTSAAHKIWFPHREFNCSAAASSTCFSSLFVSHLSVSLGSALLCPPCGHLRVSLAPEAGYASGLLHPSGLLLFLLLSPPSPILDRCHCGVPCFVSFYYENHTGVLESSSCPHWAPITRMLDAFLLYNII